jgi:hypothetical protein
MAIYPLSPTPSSISAAAIIDPMHTYVSDQGYELRRPMHSRGRRQFQVEYLGKTSAEMRVIRDFFQTRRVGALDFEWLHSTAFDTVTYTNTSPVVCVLQHSYQTGQMVWINSSAPNTSLNGFWTVQRIDPTSFALAGSNAGGAGSCNVVAYLPHAVGRFADGVMEFPTKLLGPETNNQDRFSWWSFSVVIEEVL